MLGFVRAEDHAAVEVVRVACGQRQAKLAFGRLMAGAGGETTPEQVQLGFVIVPFKPSTKRSE